MYLFTRCKASTHTSRDLRTPNEVQVDPREFCGRFDTSRSASRRSLCAVAITNPSRHNACRCACGLVVCDGNPTAPTERQRDERVYRQLLGGRPGLRGVC